MPVCALIQAPWRDMVKSDAPKDCTAQPGGGSWMLPNLAQVFCVPRSRRLYAMISRPSSSWNENHSQLIGSGNVPYSWSNHDWPKATSVYSRPTRTREQGLG